MPAVKDEANGLEKIVLCNAAVRTPAAAHTREATAVFVAADRATVVGIRACFSRAGLQGGSVSARCSCCLLAEPRWQGVAAVHCGCAGAVRMLPA